MEIKYTIEILTKDIQDIEKLVGNLRNSEDDSTIDLDLALSKLRNVYEILTMIKADRLSELITGNQNLTQSEVVSEEKKPEPAVIPEPEKTPEAEAKPVAESQAEAETVPEPKPGTEPVAESQAEAETVPEPKSGTEPVAESQAETADPSILAEKFSAESSINENLAGKQGNDIESKLVGQPIDNISRNIGINDRFLIIRELFEGDSDQFRELVNSLDSADNYEAAMGIMEKQFAESMDHEGVEILEGLVKRRHIR